MAEITKNEWKSDMVERKIGVGEPFAGYSDWEDCIAKNQDVDDPEAYCGSIKAQTENWPKKEKQKETIEHILIQEKLRPFVASFFAAEPGISENGREYSEEVLRKAVAPYMGKPFIMDHDYQNSRQVQGRILKSNYETRYSPFTKQSHQGLWLDGIGLMDEDLYQKMQGDSKKGIPPLIRGVSIGGDGKGELTSRGTVRVTDFRPMELSGTAFPGIPAAHVSVLAEISESIKASNRKDTIDLANVNVRGSAKDISLNQGIGNMPTMAEAVQEVAAAVPDNKIQEKLPRSPTRRVSMDGRTVAFPTGVKASAPAYNELTTKKELAEASVKFNPPQVPDIVAEPPPPQPGILPAHPTGTITEPNAELAKQLQDQKDHLGKIEAELQALRNKEMGPTRGGQHTLTAGPHEPPGGLPPPVPDLSQGAAQPTPMTGSPWIGQDADPAAGNPEFDKTVHSSNPNLHPIPTNPAFAPRAGSPTLPNDIVQRYGTKESRQPQERQLVDTRTVSGLAVPQPIIQQVNNQRYHARTEDVMRSAARHLEAVQKQRPNLSPNEQMREAWYRSINELTGKTRTAYKQVP